MIPLLFSNLPRRPNHKLMHVFDAGMVDGLERGAQFVRMSCDRCNYESDWMVISTVTQACRGLPCPNCNNKELKCPNQK